MEEDLLNQLQMEDSKSLLQKQQEDEDERKKLLREQLAERIKAAQIPPIDWTPLAAQLDALAGGKLAQTAAESNLAQTQGSQKKIDELLAAQLAGGGSRDAEKQNAINRRFAEAQDRSAIKDILNKKSKLDSEASKIEQDYATIENAFTPNPDGTYDLRKVLGSLSNYARSVGGEKGALSEGDVNRSMYLRDLETTLFEMSKIKIGKDGKIPAEKLRPYIEQMQVSKASTTNRLRNNFKLMKEGYAANPYYSHLFNTPEAFGEKVFSQSFVNLERAGAPKRLIAPKAETKKQPEKNVEKKDPLDAMLNELSKPQGKSK